MVNLEQLQAAAMCSTPSGGRKQGCEQVLRTVLGAKPSPLGYWGRKEATFSGKSVQLFQVIESHEVQFVDLP
jgi:hypothetical protein